MMPIISKRNMFMERWSKAEFINRQLSLVITFLIIINGFLAFLLVYVCVKPKPVYFVSSQSIGVMNPAVLPEIIISNFAQAWLLNWTNFTPVTVKNAYIRAEQWMTPQLLAKTQQQLKDDISQVQSSQISSQFALDEDPQISIKTDQAEVVLKGKKSIYVSNQNISNERLVYTLKFKKVSPTQSNPYGYAIDEIEQEKVN